VVGSLVVLIRQLSGLLTDAELADERDHMHGADA
jgi:hypothetical protein